MKKPFDNSNLEEFEPFFDWLDLNGKDINRSIMNNPDTDLEDFDCWFLYESMYFANTGIRCPLTV